MDEQAILREINKIKAGDQEASYTLWQTLSPIWVKWKKAIFLDGMDNQDLEQQSYLILLEALQKYNPQAGMSFLAFYKVRLHVFTSRQLRKAKFNYIAGENVLDNLTRLVDSLDLAQQVENQMLSEPILQALSQMTPQEQQLIRLSILEGLEARQIASIMGLTEGTIRKKKKRLIQRIQNTIKKPLH